MTSPADDHEPACHAHHGLLHEPVESSQGGPSQDGPGGHSHPAPHTHSAHGITGHRPRQRRALLLCLVLTLVAMVAETVGGLWTGSLMLLSDAVHMLSHTVSLGVSWLAIWVASRPRSRRSHFGLYRAEILASFVNGLGLLVLCGWIVFEAVERLASPHEVLGTQMIAIAFGGLVVNVATAWILARSGAEDLNTRSALMHMLGDLVSSIAIVVGGAVLIYTGWVWIDPMLSLLVALLILWWGLGLLKESTSILLERAPKGLEPMDLERAMVDQFEGVQGVHDLHVWEITSGYVCLTAHLVVEDSRLSETDALRRAVCDLLWRRYRVAHVTLQVESAKAT